MQIEKKRIAFIFIEEIHHLYHFITIAIELSKTEDVHILTFTDQDHLLEKSLAQLNENKIIIERRSTLFFREFTDKLKNRKLPRAGFWMKKNHNYILKNFDAVVFTDYNHHKLLKYKNKESLDCKFLKLPHGAPGRSYSYNDDLLDFDLQLIFGNFQYQEYKKKNLLGKYPILAGYPKKDAIDILPKSPKIFNNKKLTVIYNPHFSKPLSSWYYWGYEILEFFYNNKNFNLIFAPHINLFNKIGFEDKSSFPKKYFEAENIHVDLGSDKSVDMTYTLQSDLYLGDVSSQVYEFILDNRPCLFLNPTGADHKGKLEFRFWELGYVIDNLKNLKNKLAKSFEDFEIFAPIQRKFNSENFYIEENRTASEIAADKIRDYLRS